MVTGAVVLAAFALALPASAGAATLNVPADFATIQEAVDAAQAGDIVAVKARKAEYFESVDVTTGEITIRGAGGSPIIDAFDPNTSPPIFDITADDVVLRDLSLRNEQGVQCTGEGCTIRDVVMRGKIDPDCIEIDGPDALVADSRFEACGNNAVDIDGADARLLRNVATGIDSDCYFVSQADNAVIRDNRATRCEDGEGLEADDADGAVIEGNLVRGTDNGSYDVDGDDMTITANTAQLTDARCWTINGDDVRFEENVSTSCKEGIDINGDRSAAIGNVVTHAQNSECIQFDGNEILARDNVLEDCLLGIRASGENPVLTGNRIRDINADDGINVFCEDDTDPPDPVPEAEACDDVLVADNSVKDTGDDDSGISVNLADNTGSAVIRDNKARGAFDDAMELNVDGALIEGNRLSGGGAEEEEGLEVLGSGNVIQGNVSRRNGGDGIRVNGDGGNVIRDNVVEDNNQDGIWSNGDLDLIEGNTSTGNLGEGIEFKGVLVDVTGNVSSGNRHVDCANDGTFNENEDNECEDGSDFLVPSSGFGS